MNPGALRQARDAKPETPAALPPAASALVHDVYREIHRIAIVTDAWHPQVNGVVTTLEHVGEELGRMGKSVEFITPASFTTIPCPTYPSIRLALAPARKLTQRLLAFEPDAIHVATEGPLGMAGRAFCRSRALPFTTSYHTQFPEYVRARLPIPLGWTYAWMRNFHAAAAVTLVATPAMLDRLAQRGFGHLQLWSRGVDTALFRPRDKTFLPGTRPLLMYLGRVAIEKNLEAFLDLDLPGTKVIIGDGPDLPRLRARYQEALFLGAHFGEDLARHLACADVLVFPSLTDTFGLVMLEAMACGVPVAAYPVTGPIDVVETGRSGVLDDDLATAVRGALTLNPADCIAHARRYSWRQCAEVFYSHLQVLEDLG